MDFAAGNGADTSHEGRQRSPPDFRAGDSTLPASIISSSTEEPAAMLSRFAREYYMLSDIATNMRSGFILLNSAEQVAYSNPSAERLLGVSSQALVEEPVFDVRRQLVSLAANPESAQAELDRIWLHPEQESSIDLALADAAIRWLRVQSFPVRDNPDHLLGRGVLLDDITLERSSMQARSEILALAAHELKTPLAIIKGSATTLLGNSLRWDPSMLREMLQMIDTQADRLHDILNTLLDVWRLDAGAQNLRLSEVHISKLLEQLLERWRMNALRHQFVLSIPTEDVVVQCDALRIEQALNHLLNNAVTYSSTGGTIRIHLETNEVEVCLSVADQGAGIAPEHLDRIFDRFYRISPGEGRSSGSSSGSGLGLSFVRATIEAHGGKTWADSPGIGLGTTFYCTLPFTPHTGIEQVYQVSSTTGITALPSGPLTASRTGPLRQNPRSKVVVVENDARIARYLRAHLVEQQYDVHIAGHGIQFLRQLDLEEPDIILLATRLSDMSGVELLQRLREFSRTPVMMLCDECEEDERVRLLELGADDLVVKPFGIKELLARVRVLLRRSAGQWEQPISETIFRTGELTIDYAQHQVHVQGCAVQLSRTEYKLLCTLAQNVGRVMTHELLLERVWGAEYNREVDFIWVYISRLRRKIEADPRHPRYILTMPDVGYKLAKL
jgi:DNA-binding response OmpR family regulator/signal transduction histidine kinase